MPRIAKGGAASITCVLPLSLRVNHTCLPSALTARLGENGLACGTRATTSCEAVSITHNSGVKLDGTNAYLPSGRKRIMAGPELVLMRAVSSRVSAFSTAT